MPFVTLDDVKRLEKRLEDLEKRALVDGGGVNICVAGGGPVGTELAALMAERLSKSIGSQNTKVSVYIAFGDLLEGFPESAKQIAKENLAADGVPVFYDHVVEKISVINPDDPNGEKYMLQINARGKGEKYVPGQGTTMEVPTDLVLWTAGTKPNKLGEQSFPGAQAGRPI